MPYVTLVSDWQDLADKVFKSVNGDKGGCWAPSSRIVVDTAGMVVTVASTVNFGGTLETANGARFVLGNSEWPSLSEDHIGRTRSIMQLLGKRMSTPRYHWCDSPDWPGAIQSLACTILGASGLEQPKCHIPLDVHDGARLTSVTLTFRIPTEREVPPIGMPRLRVVRVDRDGTITPLMSVDGGADADGYVSMPAVTSGSEWYAGGAAQTFEYECDQNNTIDTSLYWYEAQLVEEVGAALPMLNARSDGIVTRERKAIVYHVFTTPIFLSGTPVGGVAANGDPVLVTANADLRENGIWIVVAGGAWTRRVDAAAPIDFTPHFLVLDIEESRMWECVRPDLRNATKIGDTTGGDEIEFQYRVPKGNIYHSATCHFDSIADMRPQ